jgi:hypothetical protein
MRRFDLSLLCDDYLPRVSLRNPPQTAQLSANMKFPSEKDLGHAMANSLIAVALMDALAAKNVLDISEATHVIEDAKASLGDDRTPMSAVRREAFSALEALLRERSLASDAFSTTEMSDTRTA